jgi:hypothetical protein
MCGVDGSLGVVERGNGGDGGTPYGVKLYLYKIEKCILEDIYLHHRDDILLALHHVLHHILVTS